MVKMLPFQSTIHNSRLHSGFTLIELLVVLGIMGILLSVGIASYSSMNDQAKVKQGTEILTTQLRAWQKQTDSGVGRSFCGGATFGGLTISPVVSGSKVTAFSKHIVCGGSPISDGSETMNVPTSLVVGSFSEFTFLPLGGGVNSAQTVQVTNNAHSVTQIITIASGGGITVTASE